MKLMQESQSPKLSAYNTILQIARRNKAEGLCQTAEDLYEQAIAMARAIPEPSLLIESLCELATYYSFQSKDEQAKPLWEEIATHGQKHFQPNNNMYVQSIFSLALLNEKNGNALAAESLYKELLQKQEAAFGDESLEICQTVDKLAAFYCGQKQYSLAESLYLRILVIKEFHLGTCSVEINYTVNALIDIFQRLGKWRLAEYMLNRQKAILVALHGKESLCVASCALRLAELQAVSIKQLDTAIDNLSFAVQTYKNKFGEHAGPVIALQKKLDQMLLARLESKYLGTEIASEIKIDEAITVDLGSPPFPAEDPTPSLEPLIAV